MPAHRPHNKINNFPGNRVNSPLFLHYQRVGERAVFLVVVPLPEKKHMVNFILIVLVIVLIYLTLKGGGRLWFKLDRHSFTAEIEGHSFPTAPPDLPPTTTAPPAPADR